MRYIHVGVCTGQKLGPLFSLKKRILRPKNTLVGQAERCTHREYINSGRLEKLLARLTTGNAVAIFFSRLPKQFSIYPPFCHFPSSANLAASGGNIQNSTPTLRACSWSLPKVSLVLKTMSETIFCRVRGFYAVCMAFLFIVAFEMIKFCPLPETIFPASFGILPTL